MPLVPVPLHVSVYVEHFSVWSMCGNSARHRTMRPVLKPALRTIVAIRRTLALKAPLPAPPTQVWAVNAATSREKRFRPNRVAIAAAVFSVAEHWWAPPTCAVLVLTFRNYCRLSFALKTTKKKRMATVSIACSRKTLYFGFCLVKCVRKTLNFGFCLVKFTHIYLSIDVYI